LQRAQQRDTVSQVASGLAHDLNNLMAVVAGTTESLATHADGQIWLEEGLQRIGRAIDMAGDLIKGLGDLARPEQPKQMLDLCRLLQDAVELLGDKRIEQHNLRLELPKHGPSVWCHPTELAQVILNLTINACDSGSEHHPATVSLTAHPAGTPPPSRAPDAGILPLDGAAMATFTVADTGRGISDTERLQLFRSNFATGGNSKIGLGLLIVSTILRANRAGIWVDSAPERGTTMTVAWPMVPPDATKSNFRRLTTSPLATANSANDLTRLRVLIVDDLLDVADVFAEMLEAAGAVASTVCDPEEAANVLSEAPDVWSVLVTDLHMDRMDGRALAQHARLLSPPVPVVLVTARPDILAGTPTPEFSAVLSKPVTAADLVAVVRDAVDRNRNDINT
jgi:CheY-like chemotaxis protein